MLVQMTSEEFNEFSEKQENSIFFQSSYWGELKNWTGWTPYMLGYKEDSIKAGL